jgi:hypothetical protein
MPRAGRRQDHSRERATSSPEQAAQLGRSSVRIVIENGYANRC